jgi:hypothetical protein
MKTLLFENINDLLEFREYMLGIIGTCPIQESPSDHWLKSNDREVMSLYQEWQAWQTRAALLAA